MQKLSFNREADKSEQRVYFRQPLWIMGLSFVILGAISDFVCMGLIPQSLFAQLAQTTILMNMVRPRAERCKCTPPLA